MTGLQSLLYLRLSEIIPACTATSPQIQTLAILTEQLVMLNQGPLTQIKQCFDIETAFVQTVQCEFQRVHHDIEMWHKKGDNLI